MVKIKSFNLKGLRGVKSGLPGNLDQKSILFYGDNGSGKSSISDSFEWFYKDSIDHLSKEEIDRKGGITALRNIFLADDDEAFIKIEFSNEKLNNCKSIKNDLATAHSNKTEEFNNYLNASQNENLILRYQNLVGFILATKKERLEELSNIIGFSDVTTTRATFKKIVNELKKELKIKNFDNQINNQQAHLIENLGQNITSDNQFFDTINELTKPLKLGKEVTKFDEIDSILTLIKKPEDTKIIEQQSFYNKIYDFNSNLSGKLDVIEESYKDYYDQFEKIIGDIEKINKIILEKLLSEGVKVLRSKAVPEGNCPLCLQPKSESELLEELEIRISELEKYKKEKLKLIELKEPFQEDLTGIIQKIGILLSDAHFELDLNKEMKAKVENLKTHFEKYLIELEKDILDAPKITLANDLSINRNELKSINYFCETNIKTLKEKTKDSKTDIVVKIELSKNAYSEIKKQKKEKEILENQKTTLELIYGEFIKKQKDGLESFLTSFSKEINELYQFMNPDEKVEDIKLIPIEKGDELVGLTLEYKFYDKQETPPHKYLSQSHLNCFGIAFFLTSVKAFNKNNKFFILDDVISSFDTNHRKRFADLLIEKFSDYQIILLTHEKNWFDYVKNIVKGKNWQVNTIKWNEDKGTHIDEPFENLQERIESKIKASDVTGLGNDIRKYLEHLLKTIAYKIKVKVDFRYNDTNEDRMSYELLTALKSKINKQPCDELKKNPIFDRLLSSLFVGNKDSHDSTFDQRIGDCKAFWSDVNILEDLFYCDSCQKYVSLEYYDNVKKKIRCGCENIIYSWKK